MTRISSKTRSSLPVAILCAIVGPVAVAQESTTVPDPTVKEVQAGDTVQVVPLPDQIYLRKPDDPEDIIWDRIPGYRTFVSAAPPVHASTRLRFDPEQGVPVYFQLARTDERFYVRLRWQDLTEDRDTTIDGFRDGAAIQMALNGADTSYMMGTGPDQPVNIWYWRADREEVENLAAGGYGSTTTLDVQDVAGASVYHTERNERDNEWMLVMSRPLAATGEHEAGLEDDTLPIAFALWQGAEEQRDGNKRVSHGWILAEVQPKSSETNAATPGSAQEPGTPVPADPLPPSDDAPGDEGESGPNGKTVPKAGGTY